MKKVRSALQCGRVACLLILLGGCGANKLVIMEYDHQLNFSNYHFTSSVSIPNGPGYSEISTDGTWLVYHICTIENNDSAAEDFKFTLSKFFVLDVNGEHHVSDIEDGDLTTHITNIPGDYPYIDDGFRSEVQTAPLIKTIPANSTSYLSVSWRFAILVHPPVPLNPHNIAPDLRYDNSGGESILLIDRGHQPTIVSTANENMLSPNCRPKLN